MIITIAVLLLALISLKFAFIAYVCLALMVLTIIFSFVGITGLYKMRVWRLEKISMQLTIIILLLLLTLYVMFKVGYYAIPSVYFFLWLIPNIFQSPFHNLSRSSGKQKMSAIILKFASPLLEECRDFKDEEAIIQLSIIAWNVAVSKESMSNKRVNKEIKRVAKHLPVGVKTKLINKLVQKKKRYYDKHHFRVLSYSFTLVDDDTTNLKVFGTLN